MPRKEFLTNTTNQGTVQEHVQGERAKAGMATEITGQSL
jgi:hypothetical protein